MGWQKRQCTRHSGARRTAVVVGGATGAAGSGGVEREAGVVVEWIRHLPSGLRRLDGGPSSEPEHRGAAE